MSKECLNCANFSPKTHEQWKPLHDGQRFELWNLRNILAEQNRTIAQGGWPGTCALAPTPVEVRSAYKCGSWSPNESMVQSWWEYAQPANQREEIESLRQKLKKAREVSIARFKRIKELTRTKTKDHA